MACDALVAGGIVRLKPAKISRTTGSAGMDSGSLAFQAVSCLSEVVPRDLGERSVEKGEPRPRGATRVARGRSADITVIGSRPPAREWVRRALTTCPRLLCCEDRDEELS
jgi:nucleotide-binding universal stress UspA family protein